VGRRNNVRHRVREDNYLPFIGSCAEGRGRRLTLCHGQGQEFRAKKRGGSLAEG